MKKMKLLLVWSFSIISLIFGICSTSFTISNVLFILAGLCIMPPIVNRITVRTDKYTRKMKWIVFIVLTILAYETVPVTDTVEVDNIILEQSVGMNEETLLEEKESMDEEIKEEQVEKQDEVLAKIEKEEITNQVEEQSRLGTEEQQRKQAEEQAKKQIQVTTNPVVSENGSTVYRTPSGKRYHLDPDCGGKNSSATTLDSAKASGLTPCQKCAN